MSCEDKKVGIPSNLISHKVGDPSSGEVGDKFESSSYKNLSKHCK